MGFISALKARFAKLTGGQPERPDIVLDRWLLPLIDEHGPFTAETLAASPQAGIAGAPTPVLASHQLTIWVRDAHDRKVVETRETDAVLLVTDSGRAGVAEATPSGLTALLEAIFGGAAGTWATAVRGMAAIEVSAEATTPAAPGAAVLTRAPALGDDDALAHLAQIEHVVVVMMENRSFDHMLGYLSLRGNTEVRGLHGDEHEDYEGIRYTVGHLSSTRFPKTGDPNHSAHAVAEQLDPSKGGFAGNFSRERGLDPNLVLGFYDETDLLVYDHLAHHFCVCDSWHSSVPGATWPNRLYSLAGRDEGGRGSLFGGGKFLFDVPTFVRQLAVDPKVWRWYSHDPATLRLADSHFRPVAGGGVADLLSDHFRFFDKRAIAEVTKAGEEWVVREATGFLDDAKAGDLPQISWIDPNFVDLSIMDPNSNDDHPPSDVLAGQQFVLDVYRAVIESPAWPKTMLVFTYDEHGGFYDHVPPPPVAGEKVTYGVRVPAIVVSPFVEAGVVSHELFDHTSLIRTVLERFAPAGLGNMPARAQHARHLGHLLTRTEPPRRPSRPRRAAGRAHRAPRGGPRRRPGPGAPRDLGLPGGGDGRRTPVAQGRAARRTPVGSST